MELEDILTKDQIMEVLRGQLLVYKLFVIDKHVKPFGKVVTNDDLQETETVFPLFAQADLLVFEWSESAVE